MKSIVSILFTLFVFCSSCNLIDPPTHISDDIAPYVELINSEARKRDVKIKPIKIVLQEIGTTGLYVHSPYWDRKIIIDKSFFYSSVKLDDDMAIAILAHEYGH